MKTLLVDQDPHLLANLEAILYSQWPSTGAVTKCTRNETALKELVKRKYDLLFLNVRQFEGYDFQLDKMSNWVKQTILMADSYAFATTAVKCGAVGYLLKPIDENALIQIMEECLKAAPPLEVDKKKQSPQDWQNQIICIPTIDGAEFLKPEDIIRCEGLQKCTRIFNVEGAQIVSSYHLGIFAEMLQDIHFIQPHRSHLINLMHARNYLREGTIIMSDGSAVPVSRRKKSALFKFVRQPHLIKRAG